MINQFVYFESPGEPSLYARVHEIRGNTAVLKTLVMAVPLTVIVPVSPVLPLSTPWIVVGPAFAYGMTHQGLRFTLLWVLLGIAVALLLLTLVRGDLMQTWRASLPQDAPNAFLINVLPDQRQGVPALIKRELAVDAVTYPMVRGRLVEVNGRPFDTSLLPDARSRQLGEREFNLSSVADLPAALGTATGAGATQVSIQLRVADHQA